MEEQFSRTELLIGKEGIEKLQKAKRLHRAFSNPKVFVLLACSASSVCPRWAASGLAARGSRMHRPALRACAQDLL